MIQIAVVSGKGGTGKTTISASLAFLFDKKNLVMADCDVDAPNLHLILKPEVKQKIDYYGGKKAVIHKDPCIKCGVCEQVCRFDAIYTDKEGMYYVDKYACEGCNACVIACPVNAIELVEERSGEYYLSVSKEREIIVTHALLEPGEETSGGLVAEVRKLAIEKAKEEKKEVIVIDGAPGIGCPASSSITGVSYVLIVTEPTMSGLHDLKRIIELTKQFRRSFSVVINKYDVNEDMSKKIEEYCKSEEIEILGKIPFDEDVVKSNVFGLPVVEYSDGKASREIKNIFNKLTERVFKRRS